MRFLKGNVLFFALLLLVILLFTYYAVKEMKMLGTDDAVCKVAFDENCGMGECEVFIDDSLLHRGAPLDKDSVIVMKRYASSKSKKSLYTSYSNLKIVADGDTVVRQLGGERSFRIGSENGRAVIIAVE